MQKPAYPLNAPRTALQTMPFILFALAMLALAGCEAIGGMLTVTTPVGLGIVGGLGAEALLIYLTKPADLPPADTADQIAPHESWCYETAGYAECFAHPVPNAANRLIMVDPANRFPLTTEAYNKAVADDRALRDKPPVPEGTSGDVKPSSAPPLVPMGNAADQPDIRIDPVTGSQIPAQPILTPPPAPPSGKPERLR